MQNLLPRESYHVDETGYWSRLPLVTGAFWGSAMTVAGYFILKNTPNLLYPPTWWRMLLLGLLGGFLFGTSFTALMRFRMRRLIDRLYSGDVNLIGYSPSDDSFSYRLPCTWINGNIGVGGILYIGNAELLFSPHKVNAKSASKLHIHPIADVHINVAQLFPKRNLLQRLLVPRPQPYMEITWGTEYANFLVPTPLTAVSKLSQVLDKFNPNDSNRW
jgi:hypothetical protein